MGRKKEAVENLIVALNAVLPMFLMIGLGCLARVWKMISDTAVRQMNSLCFRMFMSVMLFYNVYSSDLRAALNWKLIAFCCGGIFAEFFVGMALIPRLEKSAPARGVMLQAFFRTNVVLLGVSMTTSLFGADQIGEIVILSAVVVPLINILSVIALEMYQEGQASARRMAKGVVTNPLVIAASIGIFMAATGLRLPGILDSAAHSIGTAATPMALVLLGASLDFSKFGNSLRSALICLAERLAISPAIMITIAVLTGFRGVPLAGVMLVFACPVAVASFTMAVELGGDSDLAGEVVLLTTGLSCFTLFLWILLLKNLGLF